MWQEYSCTRYNERWRPLDEAVTIRMAVRFNILEDVYVGNEQGSNVP
jgi:hypothetical protein